MTTAQILPHMANAESMIGTEFDFGGVKERIVTRDDFPLERARQDLKDKTIAIIGYGVQGPAQALNLRDNGISVIIGQRPGPSYDKAVADGWVPGRTLFPIEEATNQGWQIQYLLSDAGQKDSWPTIKPCLKPQGSLDFSHGFSLTFPDQTKVIPPRSVDTILVAPKGAGRSVREHFLEGRGINSSFAVFQNATGRAREIVLATGMGIGSAFLFPTTVEYEVFSDLTGERGVLLGAVLGLCQANFNNLLNRGLSPRQAALHTVEILTQTISKIIGEKGADGLIQDLPVDLLPYLTTGFVCAQVATRPVFADLYQQVASGAETSRVLEANSQPDYRDQLNDELKAIRESEFGRASSAVRSLRATQPTVPSTIQNPDDALMAGALIGVMDVQYKLFRNKGHQPSEAFNETVEEATQSLYPLIDRQGIDWMFANCSTTAQRGALDWYRKFQDVLQPALRRPYLGEVVKLEPRVLQDIQTTEMWRAGKTVRSLRPESQRLI